MAFRFHRKESVADGFRRTVREQTAAAVSLLADRAGGVTKRIHEARRCVKRLRAMLRMVRTRMDEDVNDAANIALRDASRKLSGARDADVSLATFEQLAPELSGPDVARIRALLKAGVRIAHRRALSPNRLAKIAAELRACGHKIALANLSENGWPLIAPGLADSYASARHDARRLGEDSKAEVVHEWRKVTKGLSFQLELVRRALAKPQRKLLRRLEDLGVILGEHHDLDTLRTTLAAQPASAKFPELNDLITRELVRRLKLARRIAKNAFAEHARVFTSAIRVGWNEWRG